MSRPEPLPGEGGNVAELVKPPQSRRAGGVSSVYLEPGGRWGVDGPRVYVKRQTGYYCRPPWRGFLATPTLRREVRALRAWRNLGLPVPEVVAYRQQGRGAELAVMEVRGAVPLDEAMAAPGADRQDIVARLARVLGRLHRSGWTHGALSAEHILVSITDGGITLIDLEKAKRSRRLRRRDLERLRRRTDWFTPEERSLFEAEYRASLH